MKTDRYPRLQRAIYFDPPYELHTGYSRYILFGDPRSRALYLLVLVRADLPVLHLAGCHGCTPRALWFARHPWSYIKSTSCEAAMHCEAQKALDFGVWSCRPRLVWWGLAGPLHCV
jgi:hypothetical protein